MDLGGVGRGRIGGDMLSRVRREGGVGREGWSLGGNLWLDMWPEGCLVLDSGNNGHLRE